MDKSGIGETAKAKSERKEAQQDPKTVEKNQSKTRGPPGLEEIIENEDTFSVQNASALALYDANHAR